MGTERGRRRVTPVVVLGVLGALLAVGAVVLGTLLVRAGARADDRAAALAAARSHLVDLGSASADPAARSRAVDGATGTWRDRLSAAGATDSTSTVVRSIGLEDPGDDGEPGAGSARALAVGVVGGDGGSRPFRATVALARVDGRWLVADVAELP